MLLKTGLRKRIRNTSLAFRDLYELPGPGIVGMWRIYKKNHNNLQRLGQQQSNLRTKRMNKPKSYVYRI
jgi:hypothetical protein